MKSEVAKFVGPTTVDMAEPYENLYLCSYPIGYDSIPFGKGTPLHVSMSQVSISLLPISNSCLLITWTDPPLIPELLFVIPELPKFQIPSIFVIQWCVDSLSVWSPIRYAIQVYNCAMLTYSSSPMGIGEVGIWEQDCSIFVACGTSFYCHIGWLFVNCLWVVSQIHIQSWEEG